jgi:hypothetical protein
MGDDHEHSYTQALERRVQALWKALEASTRSLETLSLAGGRDQPMLADLMDVRGYANSRAREARKALVACSSAVV